MSQIDRLLQVARTYGAAEKIELTTVSSRVFDDSKKLTALESGRDIQVKRLEAALEWFSANWPVDTPWPDGIPRPESHASEAAE